MLKALPKPLAAAALALAVTIGSFTATTTAARADNDNLRTFLGAAASLVILGHIIEENRNHPRYVPVPPTRHVTPGLVPVPRFVAPSTCFSHYRGPNLQLRGFGAHCMHSHVPYHASLPDRCLEHVFTYQGWRYVYDAQCLYSNGWRRS